MVLAWKAFGAQTRIVCTLAWEEGASGAWRWGDGRLCFTVVASRAESAAVDVCEVGRISVEPSEARAARAHVKIAGICGTQCNSTVGALCVCARSWAGPGGQCTSSGAGPVVSGRRLEIAQLALPSNRSCVVDSLGAVGIAIEGDVWADNGGKASIVDGSTLCRLWCTDNYISGALWWALCLKQVCVLTYGA